MLHTVFFSSRDFRYSQARQLPRIRAEFSVEILDDRFAQERAFDLSAAGVGIKTTRPLRLMSLVGLRLHLPNVAVPVEVLARVMWTTREGMGLRFERADPRITAFVNRTQ